MYKLCEFIHNNTLAICMQSMPSGYPQFSVPNTDRLDVQKLKQDIPKFYSWLTPDGSSAWSSFLYYPEEIGSGTDGNEDRMWPLEALCGFTTPQENISDITLAESSEGMVSAMQLMQFFSL